MSKRFKIAAGVRWQESCWVWEAGSLWLCQVALCRSRPPPSMVLTFRTSLTYPNSETFPTGPANSTVPSVYSRRAAGGTSPPAAR